MTEDNIFKGFKIEDDRCVNCGCHGNNNESGLCNECEQALENKSKKYIPGVIL